MKLRHARKERSKQRRRERREGRPRQGWRCDVAAKAHVLHILDTLPKVHPQATKVVEELRAWAKYDRAPESPYTGFPLSIMLLSASEFEDHARCCALCDRVFWTAWYAVVGRNRKIPELPKGSS